MKFNISGFTHKGTGKYLTNEDNVLINGTCFNEGKITLLDQEFCTCFISDGVGGNQGGFYASTFVLTEINKLEKNQYQNLNELLYKINEGLLASVLNDDNLKGCACTLSGIIANCDLEEFFHIGDSEIWLLRDDMLMKISKDEVLDEDNPGSPLTNYLGGDSNKLKVNTDWHKPELLIDDIFLICSDGLFKSLNAKLVKPILSAEKSVEEKVLKLKENCLNLGSEDNVSAVVIETFE